MLISTLQRSASTQAGSQGSHAGLLQAQFGDNALHCQPATGQHQPGLLWMLYFKPAMAAEVDRVLVAAMYEDSFGGGSFLVELSDLGEVPGNSLGPQAARWASSGRYRV